MHDKLLSDPNFIRCCTISEAGHRSPSSPRNFWVVPHFAERHQPSLKLSDPLVHTLSYFGVSELDTLGLWKVLLLAMGRTSRFA